jgi:hypothetical protein
LTRNSKLTPLFNRVGIVGKVGRNEKKMTGKPLPNEVKARRGTLRPSRVGDRSLKIDLVQGEYPEPPNGLGEIGSEFWNSILTEAGGWVSYKLDTHLLRIVCEQLEEREELRVLVRENPDKPRLRTGLRELEKSIQSNLSSLGLTPSDRARLGFVQIKGESKLEELMRLKAERVALAMERHDYGA